VLLAGLTKPGEVGEILALYRLKSLSLDYQAKLKSPCFFLQVTTRPTTLRCGFADFFHLQPQSEHHDENLVLCWYFYQYCKKTKEINLYILWI
jgi:proteasome assembly chaperone (PAC2) family protein